MRSQVYHYPVLIKEVYLDTFGHMNNATYLMLLEEARWDLLNRNNYGMKKIMESGVGPTILDIKIRFMKEIFLRDAIVIETKTVSYEKKIGLIHQRMLRGDEVCCSAEFTIALFDLHARRLLAPTPEWLAGIGVTL